MIVNPSNVLSIAIPSDNFPNEIVDVNYYNIIKTTSESYTFKLGTKGINGSYNVSGFDINNNFLECNSLSDVSITLNNSTFNTFNVLTNVIYINTIANYDGNLININVTKITPNKLLSLRFERAEQAITSYGPWSSIIRLDRNISGVVHTYDVYNCYLDNDTSNLFANQTIKLVNDIEFELLLSDGVIPSVTQYVSNIYNNTINIAGKNLIIDDSIVVECIPPYEAFYKVNQ